MTLPVIVAPEAEQQISSYRHRTRKRVRRVPLRATTALGQTRIADPGGRSFARWETAANACRAAGTLGFALRCTVSAAVRILGAAASLKGDTRARGRAVDVAFARQRAVAFPFALVHSAAACTEAEVAMTLRVRRAGLEQRTPRIAHRAAGAAAVRDAAARRVTLGRAGWVLQPVARPRADAGFGTAHACRAVALLRARATAAAERFATRALYAAIAVVGRTRGTHRHSANAEDRAAVGRFAVGIALTGITDFGVRHAALIRYAARRRVATATRFAVAVIGNLLACRRDSVHAYKATTRARGHARAVTVGVDTAG